MPPGVVAPAPPSRAAGPVARGGREGPIDSSSGSRPSVRAGLLPCWTTKLYMNRHCVVEAGVLWAAFVPPHCTV